MRTHSTLWQETLHSQQPPVCRWHRLPWSYLKRTTHDLSRLRHHADGASHTDTKDACVPINQVSEQKEWHTIPCTPVPSINASCHPIIAIQAFIERFPFPFFPFQKTNVPNRSINRLVCLTSYSTACCCVLYIHHPGHFLFSSSLQI